MDDILNDEKISSAFDARLTKQDEVERSKIVNTFGFPYSSTGPIIRNRRIARAQYDHMVEQGWVKWDSEKVARQIRNTSVLMARESVAMITGHAITETFTLWEECSQVTRDYWLIEAAALLAALKGGTP